MVIKDVPLRYSEILTEYVRLLRRLEYNPYEYRLSKLLHPASGLRLMSYRKVPSSVSAFIKIPNAARQELLFADNILEELERLDNRQLHALARYSSLNVEKIKKRLYTNPFTKITGFFVLFPTVIQIFNAFPQGLWKSALDGLADYLILIHPEHGGIGAFIFILYFTVLILMVVITAFVMYLSFLPRLQLVSALDEIISVEIASRSVQ
jgi:hypothetical protein